MLFSYVSSESPVPAAHLLRRIKAVADQVLQGCRRPSPRYTAPRAAPQSHLNGWTPTSSFAGFGYESVLDMNLDEPCFKHSTFSQNSERLLAHVVVSGFSTRL